MNRKTLICYDGEKALEAMNGLIQERREDIEEALGKGYMDYIDAYMTYPKKKLKLPEDVLEALKYTSLKRNLEHESYSNDLGELWTTLSEKQIGAFFKEIVESYNKVVLRVGEDQVIYRQL